MGRQIFGKMIILLALTILFIGCKQTEPKESRGQIMGIYLLSAKDEFIKNEWETKNSSIDEFLIKGQTYKIVWYSDKKTERVDIELLHEEKKSKITLITTIALNLTREKAKPTSLKHSSDWKWKYLWTIPKDLPTGQISIRVSACRPTLEEDRELEIKENHEYYKQLSCYLFNENEYPGLEILSPEENACLEYGKLIPIILKLKNLKKISIEIAGYYVKSKWISVENGILKLNIKDYTDLFEEGQECQLFINGETTGGINIYQKRYFSLVRFLDP